MCVSVIIPVHLVCNAVVLNCDDGMETVQCEHMHGPVTRSKHPAQVTGGHVEWSDYH